MIGIIGLLLGAMLPTLSTRYELTRLRQARADLAKNRGSPLRLCPHARTAALSGHVGDGVEDRESGSCRAEEGVLPSANLGTARVDPWGNDYRYRVDAAFADDVDGTGCGPARVGASFSLCSEGRIRIADSARGGSAIVARGIPAIVLSRGFNEGDPQAVRSPDESGESERLWWHVSTTLRPRPLHLPRAYPGTGEEFDDMVIWLSPHVLKNRMVQAMKLP